MVFQKVRRRGTLSAGALPAMIAALIAPIEMPATQSGAVLRVGKRFVDSGLVASKSAAALEHQCNFLFVG